MSNQPQSVTYPSTAPALQLLLEAHEKAAIDVGWNCAAASGRILESEKKLTDTREAAAKIADQYAQVSPLHNYGPAGLTHAEKEVMSTACMIAEDIRALPLPDEPAAGA